MRSWAEAEADFGNWPQIGEAEGQPIRCDPEWGAGVYEKESGAVLSPVAFSVRRSLRRRGIEPL